MSLSRPFTALALGILAGLSLGPDLDAALLVAIDCIAITALAAALSHAPALLQFPRWVFRALATAPARAVTIAPAWWVRTDG